MSKNKIYQVIVKIGAKNRVRAKKRQNAEWGNRIGSPFVRVYIDAIKMYVFANVNKRRFYENLTYRTFYFGRVCRART